MCLKFEDVKRELMTRVIDTNIERTLAVNNLNTKRERLRKTK